MWYFARSLLTLLLAALSLPVYPQEKNKEEKKDAQPRPGGINFEGLIAGVAYMSYGVGSAKASIEATLKGAKLPGTADLLNAFQDGSKKWVIVPRELMQVEDYTKQVPVRVRLRDNEPVINVGWNFPLEYAEGPQWLCGLIVRDTILINEVKRGAKISNAILKALDAQALYLRASEELGPSKDKRVTSFLAAPPKTLNPKEVYSPAKENIDAETRAQNRKHFGKYLSNHGAEDLTKEIESSDEKKEKEK